MKAGSTYTHFIADRILHKVKDLPEVRDATRLADEQDGQEGACEKTGKEDRGTNINYFMGNCLEQNDGSVCYLSIKNVAGAKSFNKPAAVVLQEVSLGSRLFRLLAFGLLLGLGVGSTVLNTSEVQNLIKRELGVGRRLNLSGCVVRGDLDSLVGVIFINFGILGLHVDVWLFLLLVRAGVVHLAILWNGGAGSGFYATAVYDKMGRPRLNSALSSSDSVAEGEEPLGGIQDELAVWSVKASYLSVVEAQEESDLFHQGCVKLGTGKVIACYRVLLHVAEACHGSVPQGTVSGDGMGVQLEVTAVTAWFPVFLWLLLGGFDVLHGTLAGRGIIVVPVLFGDVERSQAVDLFLVVALGVHILRFKI